MPAQPNSQGRAIFDTEELRAIQEACSEVDSTHQNAQAAAGTVSHFFSLSGKDQAAWYTFFIHRVNNEYGKLQDGAKWLLEKKSYLKEKDNLSQMITLTVEKIHEALDIVARAKAVTDEYWATLSSEQQKNIRQNAMGPDYG
ncbi:uncharacterized protein LTR77_003237 [Saxophila tyrrhenica]|uniref:Uncharacterized protein n=1 Tax=Saxophila tyrrhenica TaxID=1690608 RepID=A0AAV9PLF6_9PEZI|nr:hypothetical protein LTR77_003237 [Saxophila tyrrhenica]